MIGLKTNVPRRQLVKVKAERIENDRPHLSQIIPGEHNAVGTDLAAVGEGQYVVQHHLINWQRKAFAVADDRHLCLREEGELIDDPLGADFLKNADGGIAEYDADKQRVFICTDCQYGGCQQQIDDVEQRQKVVA